jgi:lipopolysaccharide export system permease protein
MGLYYNIIPYSHHLLRSMVLKDTEELLYSMLKRQGMICHSQMPYAMWVRGVEGKKLINPIFKHRNMTTGQIDMVAEAKDADLRVDIQKRILLVHMHLGDATAGEGTHAIFDDKVWEVPLPEIHTVQRRARDMTWEEILAERVKFREEMAKVEVEISLHTSRLLLEGVPNDLPKHIENLKERSKYFSLQIRYLDVELLMRPALSLGCLFFILVGCPVGIWFSRSDYLSSFITCFLPIVIFYYPLTLCGTQMAKEPGRMNMVLLVWSADILIASVGVVLFWRLLRN